MLKRVFPAIVGILVLFAVMPPAFAGVQEFTCTATPDWRFQLDAYEFENVAGIDVNCNEEIDGLSLQENCVLNNLEHGAGTKPNPNSFSIYGGITNLGDTSPEHCTTTATVSSKDSGQVIEATQNLWINQPLMVSPTSSDFEAYPGQVLVVDRTFEFPFADGDGVLGFIETANCDSEISISSTTEPIDGTSDMVSDELTITVAHEAEIGSYHCEQLLGVIDDGFNQVSTEALFVIEVNVTPESLIEGLVTNVDELDLNKGQKESLTKKLEQASKNLTNEDPTDDQEACEKLHSFLDQLDAFVKTGKLDATDAQPFMDGANAVIEEVCEAP